KAVYVESRKPTASGHELAGSLRSVGEVIRARHAEIVRGPDALAAEAMRSNAGMVPLGLSRLDVLLHGGLLPGNLCVVAGRTSMGKTAFAVDVTRNALGNGMPVAYVTLEMSAAEVQSRLSAIRHDGPDLQIF